MGGWQMSQQKALERAIHVLKTGHVFPEEDDILVVAILEKLRRRIGKQNAKGMQRYENKRDALKVLGGE